eukprot:438538-Pelagomonas_calceolata.AAC.2
MIGRSNRMRQKALTSRSWAWCGLKHGQHADEELSCYAQWNATLIHSQGRVARPLVCSALMRHPGLLGYAALLKYQCLLSTLRNGVHEAFTSINSSAAGVQECSESMQPSKGNSLDGCAGKGYHTFMVVAKATTHDMARCLWSRLHFEDTSSSAAGGRMLFCPCNVHQYKSQER